MQINSVCGIGSTGRIASDIHKILIEKGHKSFIAYGRSLPKNCTTSIKIGTNYDIYGHAIITRLFDKHGLSSRKASQEFIGKIKELDPDIIQLHNIHGYYVNIKILFDYLKKAHKPIVWTLHDCWSFTGHCAHFDHANCNKWLSLCYRCPQKSSYPSSILFDRSKINFQMKKELFTGIQDLVIVTVSKWLRGIVEQSFLKDYPLEVIENGIDLNIFKPRKNNFRKKHNIEKNYVIAGVANIWNERKGLRYFIELSKKIEENYKIVLVGLNQKQINSLPDNIIALPKTNDLEELIDVYSTADVFLNLSVEETMGLTTVEALACGTPVIVFDATAVPEVVEQNCGLVVEKGNISRLREAIEEIKLMNITKEICIQRAKRYEKNQQYKKYLELYTKLALR